MQELTFSELKNVSGGNYEETAEGVYLTAHCVGATLAYSTATLIAGSTGAAPLFALGALVSGVGTTIAGVVTAGAFVIESSPGLAEAITSRFSAY